MAPLATFREAPAPAPAADVAAAVWTVRFDAPVDDWLVLPDGALDVVLLPGRPPVVAGPAGGPSTFAFPAGTRTAGLRLRAGATRALLGVGADELADRSVALEDLGGPLDVAAAQAALEDGDAGRAVALLAAAATRARRRGEPDELVAGAARLLRAHPGLDVGALAGHLALSPRQLHRRCTQELGTGPKRFARTMRLQRLLALRAAHPRATLGRLAAQAGYADQAHLAHECGRLAGRTPGALLGQRATVAT
jgi:AraC-like DNA-binding protein